VYEVVRYVIAGASIVIAMFFAWRSFYGMRISSAQAEDQPKPAESKPAAAA
jgi:hypothetical protein